jgi:hypothetical protein
MNNMSHNSTDSKVWFSLLIAFEFLVALLGMLVPQLRMPIDFNLMLWVSLPLAGIWLAVVAISMFKFGRKALWIWLGLPFAFYWPLWLMFNHIPTCYWHQNCI